MSELLSEIERELAFRIPSRLRDALLDPLDPIHKVSVLLTKSDNPLLDMVWINNDLRQNRWKQWPNYLIAFATNECGDYSAFDTRAEPYLVYYVDPLKIVPEAILACQREGFVFASFDDWYAATILDQSKTDPL